MSSISNDDIDIIEEVFYDFIQSSPPHEGEAQFETRLMCELNANPCIRQEFFRFLKETILSSLDSEPDIQDREIDLEYDEDEGILAYGDDEMSSPLDSDQYEVRETCIFVGRCLSLYSRWIEISLEVKESLESDLDRSMSCIAKLSLEEASRSSQEEITFPRMTFMGPQTLKEFLSDMHQKECLARITHESLPAWFQTLETNLGEATCTPLSPIRPKALIEVLEDPICSSNNDSLHTGRIFPSQAQGPCDSDGFSFLKPYTWFRSFRTRRVLSGIG